jgi:geranylgeranyl diphosphate synthase type I
LLASQAAGGEWERALPAAAAVELVHNFSLIHDDIEDNSPLRRGRPTLWKLWGIPQAINAGDAMFTLAHLSMLRLQETTSAEITLQASRILHETCLHLTQGQFLDISYQSRTDLSLDDYWPMVSGKTAALLSTCTELGAIVAGAAEFVCLAFRQLGHALGLAFQSQDDLLGIWGDSMLTGKSVESDLVEGKLSLPILYGLGQNGPFAHRWQQGPITPEEVPSMAALLENEGARHYTQSMTSRWTEEAMQALGKTDPQSEAGQLLRDLATSLLNRQV